MPNIQNLEQNRFSVIEDLNQMSLFPIEKGVPYILTTSHESRKKDQLDELESCEEFMKDKNLEDPLSPFDAFR